MKTNFNGGDGATFQPREGRPRRPCLVLRSC